MNFQPFYDRVIVEPEEESTETEGGIVLPKALTQDVREGVVIASGEGRVSPEGALIPNAAKKGDRVLFHANDAIPYFQDEKEYLAILRDTDIIAVVEE